MDMLEDILVGLVTAALLWAIGVPLFVTRLISKRLSSWRLSRKVAAGLFSKASIESAISCYVRPMYSNLDPANEGEPAHALINARADLFSMVSRFLQADFADQKHMLLFADSGMGKTSFLLNFLDSNYRLLNLRKSKILLISLGQCIADEHIRSIPIAERAETNLFLDALDEDPKAMGNVQERIQELLGYSEGFRTVLVTCRSQFFRSDEQIPIRTGLAKNGPVPLGVSKHYNFLRVYLSPFDESQVAEYLEKRFPGLFALGQRQRAREMVARIPSLSVRPMLLAHMPEMLSSSEPVTTAVEVYQAMVAAWVRRESAWIRPQDLELFSEHLAWSLFVNRKERGGESAMPDEITSLAASLGVVISSDLLTSRSLLNRTGDGRFKFAHRSIMEYFVVKSLIDKKPAEDVPITDQMAQFLFERYGCSSEELRKLTSFCTVSVRFVDPVVRLGLDTNFNLFHRFGEITSKDLLRISCRIEAGPGLPNNLNDVISDMAATAFGVDASQLKDMRIVFEGAPSGRGYSKAYISIWMNSYLAVAEVEISNRSLLECFGRPEVFGREFAVSSEPEQEPRALSEVSWILSSRVSFECFVQGCNIPSLGPAANIAFEASDSNSLSVKILKSTEQYGPFGAFGIFGYPVDTRTVPSRSYGVVAASLRNAWRLLPAYV